MPAQNRSEERIRAAIDSLISHLVPHNPNEDEESANERLDSTVELVTTILKDGASPAIASDVNHAADLIKRKLVQTNPPQALRFSHLYTRLLSLPVLNQKWAILYLLYQLADSPDPSEPLPLSPVKHGINVPGDGSRKHEKERQSRASTPLSRVEEDVVNEAFAPNGLRKFPAKESRRGPDEKHGSAGAQEAPKRDVSLKSTLLAANQVPINPSEVALLRDLPFTLQGLSSTTLPFTKVDKISLPTTLPAPLVSLLHTLAEPSLLYRGLTEFLKTPPGGLLGQSLRAAISDELRSYLSLVATLEGQIRRALSSLDDNAPRGGIGKAGVTLKRCVVWTREPTMGLRLLSLIAEESKSRRGGQLISLIHGFSSTHGDPLVGAFAERLLAQVTRPFYDILRRWIYDGELSDPFQEFFVKEQSARGTDAKAVKASSVWSDKYEIDRSMIPSIMTEDFAQKVFLIGKSLNFIRHNCADSQWVDKYSKAASKELRYGDTATLEAWIDEAYKTTMKRLMDLMTNKFHLFEHLQALKNYILLGQGDFIALLMESLAGKLDGQAGAQYRHELTAQLDHAVRGSNAQYDSPEVLRRLDARMLQPSHGDIGWDCFTLEYKIDAPVDVVVTEWGNRQYLKVFNFLWRIKRIEFALATTWRRCMTGARGVLQSADPAVAGTWKSTRGTLAEMIHFIGQLQYYILFEVIESSWTELQDRIRREGCTLDELITAHTRYLESITHKGLLGAKRRRIGTTATTTANNSAGGASAPTADENGPDDHVSYMSQLSELLRTMLAYRDTVDGLYSWCVSDDAQRQQAGLRQTRHGGSSAVKTKGRLGGTVGGEDDEAATSAGVSTSSVPSELPALQERLRALGHAFQTRLQILLGDLAYQPDVDMRFLGVAMNFNDVYQPVHKRSKSKAAAAAGGGSGGGEKHTAPGLSASSSRVGAGEGSRARGGE